MINRNVVRCSTLVVIAALALCSASTIAGSSTQKPGQQADLSLMTKGQGIPGVDVVLKKKPGGNQAGNKRTNNDGFSFDNLPFGTYSLTFDAPKLSPALAGKVEYLVVVQQFEVGAAKTSSGSKSNTSARVAVAKTKDGFDFTVGPEFLEGAINVSKSNIKNTPLKTDSQRQAAGSATGNAPQAMNVRGKIFLVEIGTTNIMIDQPGVK